jgi:flagellar biosynthetic protein FliO
VFPAGEDLGLTTLKMLGYLAVIILIILCVFYLLKRFRLGTYALGKSPQMRLLGMLNLAPKRSVALVDVCGEWLVLGVGVEGISLLSKLERAPDGEQAHPGGIGESSGFKALLQRNMRLPRMGRAAGTSDDGSS